MLMLMLGEQEQQRESGSEFVMRTGFIEERQSVESH